MSADRVVVVTAKINSDLCDDRRPLIFNSAVSRVFTVGSFGRTEGPVDGQESVEELLQDPIGIPIERVWRGVTAACEED